MAPVTQKDALEPHNMGFWRIKVLACIFVHFAFVLIVYFTAGASAGQLAP